ncbi:MAG TPA: hypothetical protein VMS11_07330 [Solirubrobacterales bacterium]|nr:hypothetical protein [Solirubrobacterales bacterium]
MPISPAEKNRVETRVDDEKLQRLDDYCEEQRRSRAFVLEVALDEFLDRAKTSAPEPAGKAA